MLDQLGTLFEMEPDIRVHALDAALLFISSFLAFTYVAILIVIDTPLVGVIESIPVVVFAVALPLYVGYMRGAVEQDSLRERVRGWIYLMVGAGMFTIQLTYSQVPQVLQDPYFLPGFVLFAFLLILLVNFSRRFVIWAYRYLGNEKTITIEDKVALASTAVGMFFGSLFLFTLGASSAFVSSRVYPVQSEPLLGIGTLAGDFLFFAGLILIEINCHHYIDKAASLYRRETRGGMVVGGKANNWLWRVAFYAILTIDLIYAGASRHRNQYSLLGLSYVVQFVGLVVLQRPVTAAFGLALALIGDSLTVVALWWHASAPPDKISTNRLIERFLRKMKIPSAMQGVSANSRTKTS